MNDQYRTLNSIKNIATGLSGHLINTVLSFISRTVFIQCLTIEYLGINGLLLNIFSMLSLAELGIGSAIVFALYKPLATGDKAKVASLVQLYGKAYRTIGIVIAVIGLSLIPFLKIIITETPDIKESLYLIYIIYLFNTASTFFFSYRATLITANQQQYIVSGLDYIVHISVVILQIPVLLLTGEYIIYLLIKTVGVFTYNILISHIAKRKFPHILSKDIKPLGDEEKNSIIRNVKALVVIKISGMLVNNTDNIIITYFAGLATVGYISNYILLAVTLKSLLAQVFQGLTASVGNFNVLKSKEKKLELFNAINLANFWLFAWAAIGIALVSNDIIKLWLGNEFILPLIIPSVLALNFYILGMQETVWIFKNTLGLFKYGRYLLLLTAALNLGFSIYLGNIWGLFGILIATTIARVATNVWYDPYAVYKFGLLEPPLLYLKKYFSYLVVLSFAAALSYYFCGLVDLNPWSNVLIKIIICSIIPNIVFLLAFQGRTEYKYLISLLISFKEDYISKRKDG